MALITVIPGMNVENPVGFVNINVPPTLPEGLQSMRLFRGSLDNASFNLATEETDTFHQEGSVSYSGTYVSPTSRDDGFSSPDTAITYSTGFTWVAVATLDPLGKLVVMATPNGSISDDEASIWLEYRSDELRLAHRFPNEGSNGFGVDVDESEFFMAFITYDPTGGGEADLALYIPHIPSVKTKTANVDGANFDESPGMEHRSVYIGSDRGVPTEGKLAMTATFNRALSESEMSSMYSSMKPWLLQRGVSIK